MNAAPILSAQSGPLDSLQEAYRLGFLRCAGWTQRDDLFGHKGVTGANYRKDRDEDLAKIAIPVTPRPTIEYSFSCYSCRNQWTDSQPISNCPREGCGTTNEFCAENPTSTEVAQTPDPLQNTVYWLKEAIVDCTVADLQTRLLIGPNRARRLFDATPTPRRLNAAEAVPTPAQPIPEINPAKKPTSAQRRWLEAIAAGQVTRNGHSWVNGLHKSGANGWKKSTYIMTCDLHNAGWIDQAPRPPGMYWYPIVLTDAGRSALGLPALLPPEPQKEGS